MLQSNQPQFKKEGRKTVKVEKREEGVRERISKRESECETVRECRLERGGREGGRPWVRARE